MRRVEGLQVQGVFLPGDLGQDEAGPEDVVQLGKQQPRKTIQTPPLGGHRLPGPDHHCPTSSLGSS